MAAFIIGQKKAYNTNNEIYEIKSRKAFIFYEFTFLIIKKPTSSNRTIRMPDDLIETLGKLANEQGISFNQLVIQCCEFALEHLEKPDKK